MELKEKNFLLAHSNVGKHMHQWHERRRLAALSLGYKITNFNMSDLHPYTIFPYLDKLWKKGDKKLLALYEALGKKIDECDIFIHYNGALIHPDFLSQFNKIKIYHCADDPDASDVISKPVALNYDICAISNPTSIGMYQGWGCKNVFFWPLGPFHYQDELDAILVDSSKRNIPLVFIGSKYGASKFRFIGKYLGLYKKKKFMEQIEHSFPDIVAYGGNWDNGHIDDDLIPELYANSKIGLNLHNSLGPINGRLYDLAAFGVCQVCDNKKNLSLVFEEGTEILGFDTPQEGIDLIRYYLAHPEEARAIGEAGRQRYLNDYTEKNIWEQFFARVEMYITNNSSI